MEKVCVLDELHSGRSHSAVGHKFVDNEAKIFIHKMTLNRNTHQARLYIDLLIKNVARSSQEPNPAFPLGTKSVFANLVFLATLYNRTTVKNELPLPKGQQYCEIHFCQELVQAKSITKCQTSSVVGINSWLVHCSSKCGLSTTTNSSINGVFVKNTKSQAPGQTESESAF